MCSCVQVQLVQHHVSRTSPQLRIPNEVLVVSTKSRSYHTEMYLREVSRRVRVVSNSKDRTKHSYISGEDPQCRNPVVPSWNTSASRTKNLSHLVPMPRQYQKSLQSHRNIRPIEHSRRYRYLNCLDRDRRTRYETPFLANSTCVKGIQYLCSCGVS